MRSICYTGLFLVVIFVGSCNKTDLYEQKAKTLDSLSGAINSVVRELQNADTILLQKSITRFTWYKQFIQQNINDTITKEEADNLQRFYSCGQNLENFSGNRRILLTRSVLINSQLAKLTEDIKKKSLNSEQLEKASLYEKTEAGKFISSGYQQQKLLHSSIAEFLNSLKGVELLIRSRNKGELPVIVKDTVSL